MNTQDLALRFSELNSFQGYTFDCQPIPGDVDLLQITVNEIEEVPVFLSVTDTQILCISHLWTEDEVCATSRTEMIEAMLDMNIPMPLSSFSRIGERYVVFGALSINSNFEDIVHEVITLSENAAEAIEAMEGFLK